MPKMSTAVTISSQDVAATPYVTSSHWNPSGRNMVINMDNAKSINVMNNLGILSEMVHNLTSHTFVHTSNVGWLFSLLAFNT